MSGKNEVTQDNRIDNWSYLWMAFFMVIGFVLLAVLHHFLGDIVVRGVGGAVIVTLLVIMIYSKWKKTLNERNTVYIILGISIVVRLCYILTTSKTSFSNPEFEIFRSVHTDLALPETFQPLFYVVAGSLYNLVGMLRLTQPYALDAVRLANEYLGIVMSIAVYYILCELEANDMAVYLCTAMTAFMPGLIILGGQITPIMTAVALMTLTILFLARWNNYTDGYNFLLMSIAFGLAVMTDMVSFVLLPAILLLVLINLVRTIKRRKALNILTTVIQTICGVAAWVVLSFAYPMRNYSMGKDTGLFNLLSDLGRHSGSVNLNTRFLSFSLPELFDVYVSSSDRNAWAYFIKSSLFGDTKGGGAILGDMVLRGFTALGLAVGASAVAMVVCDVFAKIDAKKKVNIWTFLGLNALMIGYYVLVSIARPSAASMDFRVIPFILIPGFGMLAVGINVMNKNKKLNFVAGILYYLMIAICSVFCVACAAFGLVFLK